MSFNQTQQSTTRFAQMTDSVLQAQEEMILRGEWPANRALPTRIWDNPDFNFNLFYKMDTKKWVLIRKDKSTQGVLRLEGQTLSEIAFVLLQAQAEITADNADIEAENRRIDAGLPEGVDSWGELGEGAEEGYKFQNEYQEGADFHEMLEWLRDDEISTARQMMKRSIAAQRLGWTAHSLAVAYNSLLDNNEQFYGFFTKAREARAQQERETAEAQQAAALEQSRLVIPDAESPHAPSLRAERQQAQAVRKEEDAANRALPFDELKSKAGRVKHPDYRNAFDRREGQK